MNNKINDIYNECIKIVIDGIDPSKTEEIIKGYSYYFRMRYKKRLDGEESKELLNRIIKNEKEYWSNKTSEEKARILIRDEALEKIMEISDKGYELAKKRFFLEHMKKTCDAEISQEQAKEYIALLNELKKQVQTFNYSQAAQEVSEAIMDFRYASNLTNNTSFRTGRLR